MDTNTGISRRQLIISGALGAVVMGSLAACGSSGPNSGSSGADAQVWVINDKAENPIQQKAIDAFNKTGPKTKMKLVPIPATEAMNDKVRTAMGTRNKPNIFFNWGGGSIRDYATSGLLVDFTSDLNSDPAWRDSFIPSVLKAGQINGKYFGIPMKGMQPVVLFYNKTMFAQYGAKPPKTWDDLMNLVSLFKSKNITPIVLGGADAWTELTYLEYLVDRIGGPSVYLNIAAGKADAWKDPAIKKSLDMIVQLVDAGAFGSNYSSVGFGTGAASALFAKGRGAMHLMGTWEFTGQVNSAPDFAKNDLAYTTFPAVRGGKGDPANVAGNPTNYFSVTKTDVSSSCVSFLKKEMNAPFYVEALIKAGDIPAIAGIESKLSASPNPGFSKVIYSMVQNAPSFTLSWDQALSTAEGQACVTNLQKVFNKQITPDAFVAAMAKQSS